MNLSDNNILSVPWSECALCGTKGERLYNYLSDRLFGVSGQWNFKKCPSQSCNLIWLDPRPLESELGKAYVKYYTHQKTKEIHKSIVRILYNQIKEGYFALKYHYNNNHHSSKSWKKLLGFLIYFHPLQKVAIDLSVMYLRSNLKGYLLDVGCGSGNRLKLLQQLGWDVEGVDLDPMAVQQAEDKGLRVRFGKLEQQKYPDNHFDVITMSHIIEHVQDPLTLLAECYRILKPGGEIVIVTPNAESWGHHIFRQAWIHLDPPRHLYIFCPRTLRQLVERVHFCNIRTKTTLQWSDVTFTGSTSIKKTGKFAVGERQPWGIRFWAHCMELLEFAILKVRPNLGEEIVLIAEK